MPALTFRMTEIVAITVLTLLLAVAW